MNPTPRWWRYVKRRRLICPAGHHIAESATFPEHGFVRCDHRINRGDPDCGLWVYVFAIRGGGIIVAQVELKEKTTMEELATPTAIIDYLDIFPASYLPRE